MEVAWKEEKMKIKKIWFADNRIYGEADNGQILWQSLLYYRRLLDATPMQRDNYEMDDEGIYWPDLDEDVSFESFEYENPEPQGISFVFLSHPELNAVAIGKRIGIGQGLMTKYVNGTAKPSKECEERIMQETKNVASEIQLQNYNIQ